MRNHYEPVKVGMAFGKWTVIGEKFREDNKSFVMCQCECGTVRRVSVDLLKVGRSLSCGHDKNVKHGFSQDPIKRILYRVWKNMRNRCYNKNTTHFDRYGGRGISVCDEWRSSAICFLKWAIEHRWKPGLELDRIDNNGNYEPSNCRFIEHKKNSNNRRSSIFVSYNGEKMTLAEAIEKSGTKTRYQVIHKRIKKGICFDDTIRIKSKPPSSSLS